MTQSSCNLIVSWSTTSNVFYSLRQLCFTGLGPHQGIRKSSKRWCRCSNHRKSPPGRLGGCIVKSLFSVSSQCLALNKGLFVRLHFLFIRLISSEGFPFFVDLVNQFSKIRVMPRQITLSKIAAPFCHVHTAKQQPSYWTWLSCEAWALSKQPPSPACCSHRLHRCVPSNSSTVWDYCYRFEVPFKPTSHLILLVGCLTVSVKSDPQTRT